VAAEPLQGGLQVGLDGLEDDVEAELDEAAAREPWSGCVRVG
jgi:hypothetical protein